MFSINISKMLSFPLLRRSLILGFVVLTSLVLNRYTLYSQEGEEIQPLETRPLLGPPEARISLLPEHLRTKYREIFNLLPEDKRRIFVSISQRLSPSTFQKFVELIADKSVRDIIDFLDELYLIRDPVDRERYIVKKFIQKSEEVSIIEKFYSAGPDVGIAPTTLRQVGYSLTYSQPIQRYSPQFISQGYTLGPGDSLFIYIWGRVRLPETVSYPIAVTVLYDGKIFIPLVGPVAVGGMTIESASEIIKSAVRKVLGDVEVAVSLSSLKSIPVVVMGEVGAPGIVVISGTLSPFEAIQQAGGVKLSGSLRNIEIKRDGKTFAKLDLYDLIFKGISEGVLSGITLKAWDIVFVPRIGATFAILGSVKSQGIYEMKERQMNLADSISLAGGFIPDQGRFRIRVKRFVGDKRETVLDVLVGGEDIKDNRILFSLIDGDIVEVFPSFSEKEDKYILISGYVRKSQKIPYVQQMTLKDAVMLSGGFTSSEPPYAYEVIRYINGQEQREYRMFPDETRKKGIDHILDLLENIQVVPYDRITIYPPPENEVPKNIEVKISGEVVFAGNYLMQKGDRLYDLLKKAGGFTNRAYPDGVIFIRQALKQEQLEKLSLVSQILTKELVSEYSQYVGFGGTPFRQPMENVSDMVRVMRYIMEFTGITGRIVLRVPQDIEKLKDSPYNIELQPDDEIYVPPVPNYVVVTGEVKSPATFSYVERKGAKFYIELAGGYTKYSNKSEVFIIRANGEGDTDLSQIRPGDTIVVPPRVRIPYETWYIVRDVLSVSFQGLTAGALMLNALR
ncbi:MAG: SLBB domain-containing protein [Candidatus Calescibacterium sp.]|nr:SLBB domain-containing protein [Candidatus Calescibacterium sp.]MDW8086916.1 SLBB domain-containing protein [Candidatus Calescibacterium sp.]